LRRLPRAAGARAQLLVNKYYFDWFNEKIVAPGALLLGRGLWHGGDQTVIDGGFVDGTAATIGRAGRLCGACKAAISTPTPSG
jgi:NADH:ubiquinone oxidoreductase subunit 5 (subunit L)/multisubunit Na+/H+ antiporter MnhA subunit